MEIILRPVFNRPEMLKLSLEYEERARNNLTFDDDFLTLFIIEYGAPDKTIQLIKDYPYKKVAIQRGKKHGLSKNILLGMRTAFEKANNYVVYIEDDILIHSTYFDYMYKLLKLLGSEKFSVLSSYNRDDKGSVNEVYRGHHYAALAPLISKYFFEKYIAPCVTPAYYGNRHKFVLNLNDKYKKYWGGKYKYKDVQHNEQAGLLNRLVDVALIEEDMYVIMGRVNRHQHIGYYGKNRPGGKLPGKAFEERVENLRHIISSADKMYEMTNSKQYNNYKTFSPKLKEWYGTLCLKK